MYAYVISLLFTHNHQIAFYDEFMRTAYYNAQIKFMPI